MICTKYFVSEIWAPTKEETEERQNLVSDLEEYLKNQYPTIKLELFGSSCNGFGFHKSDLDICLTFTNNIKGEVMIYFIFTNFNLYIDIIVTKFMMY